MEASTPPAPFYFSCQRTGNCCRVGTGRVWIEEQNLPAYAALTNTSVAGFVALHVVQVGAQLSLRERADGRCVLLDGSNRCSIYAQRPEQCRTFPYWPELLADENALRRAAAYCPGIQRFPQAALAQQVLPQVATLMDALLVQQSKLLLSPSNPDAIRWGNSLEVDLFLITGVARHIFVPELVATLGQKLQDIAERHAYPWSSASWQRLLTDRRNGWEKLGGLPNWS
mgnify:CR=1 FL=1|jgi:uncharacterized protein